MSVIRMHDYRDEENPRKPIQWDDNQFRLQAGGYLDRADKPLFQTSHSLKPIRREIVDAMPDEVNQFGQRQLAFSQIFMPFVQDADPFWIGGVDRGAFNQSYAPFSVVYYVIREHTEEFLHMVDGQVVESEQDYNRVLDQFNKIFSRVLQGRGRGTIRGYCSTDEMIRIGSLFFLLQMTCDQSQGLVLDADRGFASGWCGKKVQIDLPIKKLSQYARKIKNVYMSDMAWHRFMYRYVPNTDSQTMWFFNVPKFMDDDYKDGHEGSVHQWFTRDDFMALVDLLPAIGNRDGYALALVRKNDSFIRDAKRLFKFDSQVTKRVSKSPSGLYLYDDFARGYHEYAAISNYLLV